MGVSENLTDKQWELLEALVSGHASNGGAEFHFACNFGGCGITFPGGKPVPGVYDETDLLQLRSERLVTLVRPSRNLHRGKPTQLGISTANVGPTGAQRNKSLGENATVKKAKPKESIRSGGTRPDMVRVPTITYYPPDFDDRERDHIKGRGTSRIPNGRAETEFDSVQDRRGYSTLARLGSSNIRGLFEARVETGEGRCLVHSQN